jgi:cytochrome c
MKRTVFASAVLSLALYILAASPGRGNDGNSERGKDLFQRRCSGCHSLDRDKEGPRLRGVYHRQAATQTTFQYSEALKNARLVWDEATLDKWLTNPETFVPENDMAFRLENAQERTDIIAYLRQIPPK